MPLTAIFILIQDKDSIQRVLQAVDKANGYCFGVQEQRSLETMMSAAMGADFHFPSYPYIQRDSHVATDGSRGLRNGPVILVGFMWICWIPRNDLFMCKADSGGGFRIDGT